MPTATTAATERPAKQAEREIQTAILKALVGLDLRIFRQNVGFYQTPDGRPIHIGVAGQADLNGILGPSFGRFCGRRLEIEVKTATGRLSEAQQNWRATMTRMGAMYVLARSPGDVLQALAEAMVDGGGTGEITGSI